MTDQKAFKGKFFYYTFPEGAFDDADGDTLYHLVSKTNGDFLPDWISYEDITFTLSGTPNENSTSFEVMVVADDRKGGTAQQTFKIKINEFQAPEISYVALIIVAVLLAAFIFGVILVLCKKNLKRKKKVLTPDDDSYEEEDDICVEDANPKNPFAFKKEMEDLKNSDDPYKDERYKYFSTTTKMPPHAKTKVKAQAMEKE